MPRLLNINSYHYRRGGADIVYLEHAKLMESLGWENAFFAMHHPLNMSTDWSDYFVRELEYGHSYSAFEKLVMATKVVYSFEAQKKITRVIKHFRPSIAHAHCIYHHLSPAILPVLRRSGIPVVMTAHDLKPLCPAATMRNSSGICQRCKGGKFTNVLRFRCKKESLATSAVTMIEAFVHGWLDTYQQNVDQVVAPSQFLLEKYVEWGWPREKLVYIPNYADSEVLVPNFEPGTHFLYFGRLSVEKGLRTLIQAASAARISLKIAGAGPEEALLRSMASNLGLDVEFLGYRSGEDLHNLIRSAKAVILPSECFENAPLSVLESYAHGKPVVGARIGGIPELIVENETGWTFTSGSVDDLARVLEQTNRQSTAELAEMGCAARGFVTTRFTRARYVEQVLAVYAELGVQA